MNRIVKVDFWDAEKEYFISFGEAIDSKYTYTEGIWGNQEKYIPLQYTGFKDSEGKEIREGDILESDYIDDTGLTKKSHQQVYWHQPHGQWYLDNSFNQDKTFGTPLWNELQEGEYKIIKEVKNV